MKYIPQAAPFEMIDELLETNESETRTRFLIKPSTMFVDENGFFLEAGLVENMAQTAAAGMGFSAAQTNEKPPVGFIGQIKNLSISQLPQVGAMLDTRIFNQFSVMNAFIVQGRIEHNGALVAEAEFKIFLQD